MSNKPVIVFVPGAWHKAKCYDKVIDILRSKHDFTCIAVTLPSTLGDRNATFEDDIQAVRTVVNQSINQNCDVVIIAHSYGGMVGNSAIKGFTRSRQCGDAIGHHDHGHTIGLILIASGHTITGFAFMDPFFGIPPPFMKRNDDTGFAELVASPRTLFYHDLPVDEGNYWVSELTPHSLKSLFEGGKFAYAGWQDVPSWFIGTLEDKAFPVMAQRLTVGMAQGHGADVTHRWLPTSHSPFLSQPNAVVELVVEAAQDFRTKQVQGNQERHHQELSVRIWPYLWWNAGITNGVGRLIGGGMLFARWLRSLFTPK